MPWTEAVFKAVQPRKVKSHFSRPKNSSPAKKKKKAPVLSTLTPGWGHPGSSKLTRSWAPASPHTSESPGLPTRCRQSSKLPGWLSCAAGTENHRPGPKLSREEEWVHDCSVGEGKGKYSAFTWPQQWGSFSQTLILLHLFAYLFRLFVVTCLPIFVHRL